MGSVRADVLFQSRDREGYLLEWSDPLDSADDQILHRPHEAGDL